MTQKEIILAEEAESPDSTFADSIRTEEYTAFYFEKCIELHEGNHAIIYPDKITNLAKVLDEIRDIYAKINRKAAIFHPLDEKYYNYFEENRNIIEKCGWEITLNEDYQFMTLSGENTIKRKNSIDYLDIRLLDKWDERIGTDIIIPSEEYWELESTKKFADNILNKNKKNNFLFVGYINENGREKAVIYSTIHKSYKYDCVGFNYILCSKDYRGRGYGSEMISYIADFCRDNNFNNCFQWAGPSEHIVRRAGFRDIFKARSGRINLK